MATDASVLVVLESGALDADVLRAVPSLSGNGEPKVRGIFIEDEDLLGAARLPGMAEVSVASLEVVSFNLDSIRRDLTRHAEAAKMLFESAARQLKLSHSFEVARGRASDALVSAAGLSDWVVVSRALRSPGMRSRSGGYFRSLLERHSRLLFVNEPWASGSSVVALCDSGSDETREALLRAAAIASREQVELIVAMADGARADRLAEELGLQRIERLAELNLVNVTALCEQVDARLLVMHPTEQVEWQSLLIRLLDTLSCSLMLVGTDRAGD